MHYPQSMAAPELGAVLSLIFSTTTTPKNNSSRKIFEDRISSYRVIFNL